MTTQDHGPELIAALNRLATAAEQLALAYIEAHSKDAPPLDDGLPMGSEEPPLPQPPAGVVPTAPAYAYVPGQFPPISGPVVSVATPVQAQVVSPIPPQPAGLCPEHRVPWSKFVQAGVSKKSGRTYPAFWACPETGCSQKPPR